MDFDMIFARDPMGANKSGTSVVGHQDDGTRYFIQHHPNIAVPYLITIIVSTLFGTVGNILIICAVLLNKHLRSVGNIFIVNLALADLCVTSFVNPFSMVGIIYGSSWFNRRPFLCEAVASICLTSCYCSLFSIGAVACNRYIHICKNHLYNTVYTLRNSLLMCVGLWLICFVSEMPQFFGWGDHTYDKKTMSCVWDRTADYSYALFFSVGFIGLPIFSISIFYLKIFLHVRSSKMKVAGINKNGQATKNLAVSEDSSTTTGESKEKKLMHNRRESVKLSRTLFTIFVVFAVCWSPYAFIIAIDFDDNFPQGVHIFSLLFAHVNSSLNCILYGLFNRHFRESYYYLLGVKYCVSKFRSRKNGELHKTEMTTTTVA